MRGLGYGLQGLSLLARLRRGRSGALVARQRYLPENLSGPTLLRARHPGLRGSATSPRGCPESALSVVSRQRPTVLDDAEQLRVDATASLTIDAPRRCSAWSKASALSANSRAAALFATSTIGRGSPPASSSPTGCARPGLAVRGDAVGNLFGRLEGDDPRTILTGSHFDTVVLGGRYDGALGVLSALAALRVLAALPDRPRRSLEMVALCEEEDSRFHANFWGTRGILGLIDAAELDGLRDQAGLSIGRRDARGWTRAASLTETRCALISTPSSSCTSSRGASFSTRVSYRSASLTRLRACTVFALHSRAVPTTRVRRRWTCGATRCRPLRSSRRR